jgi:hypothetical protein
MALTISGPPWVVDIPGGSPVSLATTLAGELQALNRHAGGAIVGYVQASTSAGQTIKSGQGILYGVKVVAVGTTPTIAIYDNTSATGTKLMDIPAAQITANATLDFGGAGVLFATGCHIVIGGTGTTTVNVMVV